MKLLFIAATFLSVALAAGIDGKWEAKTPSRDGGMETTTFELKSGNGGLTGVVRMGGREDAIREGEVKGDSLSFVTVIDMGREMRVKYIGTLADGAIRFVRELEGLGRRTEFVAKRVL